MSVLQDLLGALGSGRIEIVDLTAPPASGHSVTPVARAVRQYDPVPLKEISRYDDRGPGWCWNDSVVPH
jgi:hypothetical protein